MSSAKSKRKRIHLPSEYSVSKIFFKLNNSFFLPSSKFETTNFTPRSQSTRSKYTNDRMQNTLRTLVRDSKFFQRTTTPYRVSKSYDEDCFSSVQQPSAAADLSRSKGVRAEERTRHRAESNQSCPC